jgi:DNA-binding transcriptional MerR regulator
MGTQALFMPSSNQLRIGAFSRRVGISAALLRAWETRYGLFAPARTASGYRLYGPEDERRARRMQSLLGRGLVLAERRGAGAAPGLAAAWRTFDTVAAERALDALLDVPEPEVAAAELVELVAATPLKRRHFARRMLETRLLALGERWHEAPGELTIVGCGPGEHDTLAIIVHALALRRRGARIVYLGADTPVSVFATVAERLSPAMIVVGYSGNDAAAAGEAALAGLTPLEIMRGDPLAFT